MPVVIRVEADDGDPDQWWIFQLKPCFLLTNNRQDALRFGTVDDAYNQLRASEDDYGGFGFIDELVA